MLVAPVIPAITDHEIEDILAAAKAAGAARAGYVLLRLPHELKILFREWLAAHYPDRAKHVMSLINQSRGGKDYDSQFGTRMRGTGPYAELLRTRFELAKRKLGFAGGGGTLRAQYPPVSPAAARNAAARAGVLAALTFAFRPRRASDSR